MKPYLIITIIFTSILCYSSCQSPSGKYSNTDSTTKIIDTTKVNDSLKSNAKSTNASVNGILNIESLKEHNQFNNGDLSIKFQPFVFQKRFVHDRYGDEWRYNEAERGDIYITSTITIDAKTKDPDLPVFRLYVAKNNYLELVGTFSYQFHQWEDYGTYLGNNADFSNDFAHTEKIRFDIGYPAELDTIRNKKLYILAKNKGCVSRTESEFGEPKVSYSNEGCDMDENIKNSKDLESFTIVKILKR